MQNTATHFVLQTFISYMRSLTSFTDCLKTLVLTRNRKQKSLWRKRKEYIEINFAELTDGHAIIPSGLIYVQNVLIV